MTDLTGVAYPGTLQQVPQKSNTFILNRLLFSVVTVNNFMNFGAKPTF
jgi:hypothetical protein